MARKPQNTRLHHSLWDRLINPDLNRGGGVDISAAGEVERLKAEVCRDLEWLLNSRRTPIDLPPELPHLAKSVVGYGLPDFTSLCLADPSHRDRLLKILEKAIEDFEPRLFNVQITFNPFEQDETRSSLHYRIDAMLRIDPAPEPVVFDTVLQLGNRAFAVKAEGS